MEFPRTITEDSGNFLFITPFVMDPNDSWRLWTGGRRLWRTDNMAVTWTAASSEPLGSGQVSALAVAPGDSQSVIVGTTDGFIYRNDAALAAGPATIWQSSRPAGWLCLVAGVRSVSPRGRLRHLCRFRRPPRLALGRRWRDLGGNRRHGHHRHSGHSRPLDRRRPG